MIVLFYLHIRDIFMLLNLDYFGFNVIHFNTLVQDYHNDRLNFPFQVLSA